MHGLNRKAPASPTSRSVGPCGKRPGSYKSFADALTCANIFIPNQYEKFFTKIYMKRSSRCADIKMSQMERKGRYDESSERLRVAVRTTTSLGGEMV